MFCPQCGCDNDAQKNYCRKCGQPLAAVHLALEGRVDQATKALDGEQRKLPHRFRIGIATFLILVAIFTIFTGGKLGFSNIQSAALILVLMMIWFLHIARKSHRVARLLSEDSDRASPPMLGQSDNPALTGTTSHASVTEQDTLPLKAEDKIG